MINIAIDVDRCTGCGVCSDFCPTSVLRMAEEENGRKCPKVEHIEDCWACDTCVGQCPQGAIHVEDKSGHEIYVGQSESPMAFPALNSFHREEYAALSASLEKILNLQFKPVAVSLIPYGMALPDMSLPSSKLRHCQSVIEASRGQSLLMPARSHACPDGTHILGLTEIPSKLASGELYVNFGKVATIEAAKKMIAERPRLGERSVLATLVTPLDNAIMEPDVIVVSAVPENIMWLCMASSYHTGKRLIFRVGGYNAICVEATLYPLTTGEVSISLGCYGCRASSNLGRDMMFMGIPKARLAAIVECLKELSKKAIPDSRSKIYLPKLPQTEYHADFYRGIVPQDAIRCVDYNYKYD